MTRRLDYAQARQVALCTLCGVQAGKWWACTKCRLERSTARQALKAQIALDCARKVGPI